MESPRDQELIGTITLVQQLLWWPENPNGAKSAKRDHVDEFRRSKNGGNELWGGLKWLENGRESQNSGEKTVQPPSDSPARSRLVKPRLAVKFYGRHRPTVAHLVVRRLYSNSRRWCLVWSDFSLRAGGYSAQMVFSVWRVFS